MNYETFKKIIDNNSTLYFDTNCLLSLYSLPKEILENYFQAFCEISNDIRISSTVELEFNRNKSTVKSDSKNKLDESIKKVKTNLFSISANVSSLKRNMKRNNIDLQSSDINDFEKRLLELKNQFFTKEYYQSNKEFDKKVYFEKIEEHLNLVFNKDNIIPEKSESEKIKCIIDGYVRAKHNYPPGYMDMKEKYHQRKLKATKANKGKLNVDELTDYLGDYFIWTDILSNHTYGDKLFITNDLKEDWWEIPKNNKLEDYSARSELIRENNSINPDSKIDFIPFDLFIFYLTFYFNVEPIESYFLANAEYHFYGIIENYLRENLNDHIENSILFEYDVNKGLKVQDYYIEIDEVTINSFEIIDMIEVEGSNENTKEILFETNFYFEAEGTWTVRLGLEDDIFDSNEGSFMINQSAISVQTKLSFTIGSIGINEATDINEAFSIESVEIVEYEGIDIDSIDVAENIYYMEEEEIN